MAVKITDSGNSVGTGARPAELTSVAVEGVTSTASGTDNSKKDFEDSWSSCADRGGEEAFKPLSHEEAKKLGEEPGNRITAAFLVKVMLWQALAGLAVTALAWLWSGRVNVAWSAFYGTLCVLVPAAFFARGFSRQLAARRRQVSGQPGSALTGFFVWEMVKIVLTVAMLFAAPRIVVQLNWLALLVGFVVTMKVYWVAAWLGLGHKSRIKKMG